MMTSCTIQILERAGNGWHIRFSGDDDSFWFMLGNFKAEQKRSHQIECQWRPRLYNGKGAWFCTEAILLKYADNFVNYAQKRREADIEYETEDLWGTSKQKQDQEKQEKAEEEKRDREEFWAKFDERKRQRQQQRDRDYWERVNHEQGSSSRHSTVRLTNKPTYAEATALLGLSATATLTVQEVKKAFHAKAMIAHPDHGGSHQKMAQLNFAYEVVLRSVQIVSSAEGSKL